MDASFLISNEHIPSVVLSPTMSAASSDLATIQQQQEQCDDRVRHSSSFENVRHLVQEEGRAARNLLVFNVLVDNKSRSSVLRSPRRQPAVSPVGVVVGSSPPGRAPRVDERRSPRPSIAHARKRGRARSVSAGRGSAKDLHARYWSFLFENLRRAVDEIYQTCETDDSVLECKETIMILERCTQDFRNLIEWLKIKWEYEHTPKPQRPASVAWEIRKTSPGKLPLQLVDKKLLGEQQSRRQLALEGRSTADAATNTSELPAAANTDTDGAVGRYLERALAAAASGPAEQKQDRVQKSSTEPAMLQRAAAAAPDGDGLMKSASADADAGLKHAARTRALAPPTGRQRGARGAATASAAVRPQTAVSPRGGGGAGRAGVGRAGPTATTTTANTGTRAIRPELKPASRQLQATAVRGGASAIRPERPQTAASVRRPTTTTTHSEPKTRAPGSGQRGPPPVRGSGSGTRPTAPGRPATAAAHPARVALQRSVTVCSDGPPAPAQAYTSCVKSHSNSSLSSTASSSGHSWADRVRGMAAAAPAAAVGLLVAEGAVAQATSVDTLVTAPELPEDDGGGWEMVKSRSRSRLSPQKAPLQRKGSAEAACILRPYSARARFLQPTSAISLPSLSRIAADDESDEERRTEAASESRSGKTGTRRGGGRPTGPLRRHQPPPAPPPATRHLGSEALRRSSEKVPTEPPQTSPLASRDKRDRPGAQKLVPKPAGGDSKHARHGSDHKHGDSARKCAAVMGSRPGSSKNSPESATETKQPKLDPADKREKKKSSKRNAPVSASPLPSHTPKVDDVQSLKDDGAPVDDHASPSDTTVVSDSALDASADVTITSEAEKKSKLEPPTCALFVDVAAHSPVSEAAGAATNHTTSRRNLASPPTSHNLTSPGVSRDLTSPRTSSGTSRDLTSPEMDDDSVDEEMVIAEKALQSAIVEEQHLEQQLAETEKCFLEVDTETDGDSTSVDTECEGDGEEETEPLAQTIEEQYAPELESESTGEREQREGDGGEESGPLAQTIEEQYAPELERLSWGDRMDLLEELEELSGRAPGRGLQMHEKLSSPSRKKTLSETIRRHHERQQKACRKRQTLMDQKTQKLRDISVKISEVRQHKEQLLERRRVVLERKMARAEAKRRQHLQEVVRRAHDEEEKAKEIAFINEMEAKNKRHEFFSQIQTQELRLAGLQEERQRRVEEKAAKEAAVEEKRRALQEERRVKLEELKQRRQERLERIHREQQDKEKERLEMAREKQRDREERISALHAAQQATAEELQKRIQQKQEDSARRHEENMDHIRQRALELSVRTAAAGSDEASAQLAPYDTKKMCTLCSVLIGSEVYLLSHLRGRQHRESVCAAAGADLAGEELLLYNLRHITDASPQHILSWAVDKDRHKTLRKRCKKIKARMVARQDKYCGPQQKPPPVEAPHRAKLNKLVKEVNKVSQGQGRGPWPNSAVSSADRALGEIIRLLEKGVVPDQTALCVAGGLSVLSAILKMVQDELERDVEIMPARTVANVSRALAAACHGHTHNCEHFIDSNIVASVLDLLMTRLTRLSSSWAAKGGVTCDAGAAALMQLIATVLTALTRPDLTHQRWSVLQDVVSYVVCVGTVDKLANFFSCVQGGPDSDPQLGHFLVQSLRLVRAMTALLTARYPVCTQRKDTLDRTGLIATLQVTQLVGMVSMLYSVLLRHQPTQRGATPPPPLDVGALTLASESLSTLLQSAKLDLHMFQTCLGFEGRSVEFRHVTSYLLWYCSHHEHPDLLRLAIQTTGYFTVRCYDNQMVIQKGNMPTVLQQLLTLPFAHFSEPSLTVVLYPTLLACSYDNAQTRAILQCELSFQILEDFLKSEASRDCHLVKVLLSQDEEAGSVKSETASGRSGSVASST